MSELHIPDEAYERGRESIADWPMTSGDAYDCASTVIDAAAPLVAAAELRRLADSLQPVPPSDDIDNGDEEHRRAAITRRGMRSVCRGLLARADELEGGAR